MFHGHGQLVTAILSLLCFTLLNFGHGPWAKGTDDEEEVLWQGAIRLTGTLYQIRDDWIVIDDQEFKLTAQTRLLDENGDPGAKSLFSAGNTVFYAGDAEQRLLLLQAVDPQTQPSLSSKDEGSIEVIQEKPPTEQNGGVFYDNGIWRN